MSIEITNKHERNSPFVSPDVVDLMSDAEVRAKLNDFVKELPTKAPIFLPTDKIPLREQLRGLIRVRNIYRIGLDSIYRPRLGALSECFRNHERCFIIGNGPSLNRTDLDALKGEVTFAVNGFFLKAQDLDWSPTFYVVEDHLVAEDRCAAIEAFKGPIKLFPAFLGYCFKESNDTIFFNHRPRKSYPHGFDFSTNAEEITYAGCTVTFTCLQLAYYFGFRKIYLVGVDSQYAIPADIEQKKDYDVGIFDMRSDDPNHFHPDYFGKGFRWHDPQVDKMVAAYAEARRVVDSTERSILNATVGGKLEIFERVTFSSLFPDARSPEEMERLHAASVLAASGESASAHCNKLEADCNAPLAAFSAELGKLRTDVADCHPGLLKEKGDGVERGSETQERFAEFPRLLLFDITKRGDGTATGDLKATLFADWPKDHLVQFYSLGHDRIGVDGAVPKVLYRNQVLSADDISRVVRWFRPDLVLYRPVPDNLALHEAAMNMIRSSDLPLAIWIMDDWPCRLASDDPELFARLDSDLRELLARADLRLSICDAMSTAFAERYKVSFKAFANAVDPQEWPAPQHRAAEVSTFVLRYAGALAKNMGFNSVLRVARAVERLASDGVDIRFEIATRSNWQKMAEPEFNDLKRTSFIPECRGAVYREWLSQADAVLIAYNFDQASKNYIQYSLANKLPECLAAGAALIAHGPLDVATISHLNSLDCAVVIAEEDEEALATTLKGLIEDPDRRRDLSERARAVAFEAHNVHRVRRALRAEFNAAVRRGTSSDSQVKLPEYDRAAHAHVDETEIIPFLFRMSAGTKRTMIDVGAHVGSSARHFVNKEWHIYCFEPDRANRESLIAKLGNKSNVTIDARGVGEKAETSKPFFSSLESTGISTLRPFRPTHEQTALVDITTVSDIVEEQRLDRIDFLKIDAEGWDFQVLRGVPWDRLRPEVIECEFEDAKTIPLGYSYQEMADFLMEKGYVIYVSEWHPIVRYGVRHDWRRLFKYPQSLRTPQAWGNLLAFLKDPGAEALAAVLEVCVQFHKVGGAGPTSQNENRSAASVTERKGSDARQPATILADSSSAAKLPFAMLFRRIAERLTKRSSVNQLSLRQAARGQLLPLLGLLSILIILAAAPAYAPMWDYRFLFWGGAGGSLLLALGFIGIVAVEMAVRRLLELQKTQIESRFQEGRKELDRRMAGLDSKLAALDKFYRYSETVRQIREVASTILPLDTTVLVISKGDDQLLSLGERRTGHFPQTEEGAYAGHHPADTAAVITHLEVLRAKGADFLLVPDTAFWWFDHYQGFRQHLDSLYQRVPTPECCTIYSLSTVPRNGQPKKNVELSTKPRKVRVKGRKNRLGIASRQGADSSAWITDKDLGEAKLEL